MDLQIRGENTVISKDGESRLRAPIQQVSPPSAGEITRKHTKSLLIIASRTQSESRSLIVFEYASKNNPT